MPICGNCGNEEPEASRFCGTAARRSRRPISRLPARPATARVTLTCPSCGNEEPEGARYCGSCSAPLSPVDRPAAPAAALTSETPRVEPGVESPSPVEALRLLRRPAGDDALDRSGSGGRAARRRRCVRRRAPSRRRRDRRGPEHGAAATADRHLRVPATAFEPDARRHVAPRLEQLSASQGALIAQVRLLGPGVASSGRAAARGRGARLRPGRDTTGPRRPGSGRQHGGRCARAVASRACGPSRVCGGGCSLPHSAPVPHQRTGAGGDHAGGAGAARLREPHGRRSRRSRSST